MAECKVSEYIISAILFKCDDQDISSDFDVGKVDVDLPLCLLFGFVEVLIECARGETYGLGAAAVLLVYYKDGKSANVQKRKIREHFGVSRIFLRLCNARYSYFPGTVLRNPKHLNIAFLLFCSFSQDQ